MMAGAPSENSEQDASSSTTAPTTSDTEVLYKQHKGILIFASFFLGYFVWYPWRWRDCKISVDDRHRFTEERCVIYNAVAY